MGRIVHITCTSLTWDSPVQGNFELGAPNSVHGCTLIAPLWRRTIQASEVQCARAVHVQVFWTYCSFLDPTGQTVGIADANLAGHMYTIPCVLL